MLAAANKGERMGTQDKEERRYARVFMCIVADEVLEETQTQTAARAASSVSPDASTDAVAGCVPRPVTIPPLPSGEGHASTTGPNRA
jgi:hypothetical protein